ncbi:MAG: hypothetical protein AMXMBFR36_39290 [Acidobacteriota bacterium]
MRVPLRISHFGDRPVDISGRRLEKVLFDNCSLGPPSSPRYRSRISDIALIDCAQLASGVCGAILENVIVSGLSREGRIPLFLSGVVFNRCRLEGRISFFKLHAAPSALSPPSETAVWLAANQDFYQSVDWALDIQDADFTFGPDLHFVPGALVKRHSETQALVRRSKLTSVSLGDLPWGKSSLSLAVQWFLQDSPYEDTVLVAAKKSRGFADDLAAIRMLRENGIAEPA